MDQPEDFSLSAHTGYRKQIAQYDISQDKEQLCVKIFEMLMESGEVTIDSSFSAAYFKGFEALREDKINYCGPAIRVADSRPLFHILFTEISDQYIDFRAWGVLQLKKDYGHIFIRPETFLDKIHELIHSAELDFEDDKAFSSAFFVLTNDREKTVNMLTPSFRQHIMEMEKNNFIIEIVGNTLIIGNDNEPDPDSVISYVSFLKKISRSF